MTDSWDEVLDWERWAKEVLTDWRVPFDNHKVGLRLGITQQLCDLRDERDALAARLAEAERVILRMAGEGFARAKIYVDKYDLTGEQAARATDSATACLGGGRHWRDINAVTGQTECRLCHKSPGPSAKESL